VRGAARKSRPYRDPLCLLEAAEVLLGFAHGGGDPTHDNRAVTPAAHVVGEVGDLAVETLDEVGRAQAAVEPPRDAESH